VMSRVPPCGHHLAAGFPKPAAPFFFHSFLNFSRNRPAFLQGM